MTNADELDKLIEEIMQSGFDVAMGGLPFGNDEENHQWKLNATAEAITNARVALNKWAVAKVVSELESIPLDNRGGAGVWLSMSLEERDSRIKEVNNGAVEI